MGSGRHWHLKRTPCVLISVSSLLMLSIGENLLRRVTLEVNTGTVSSQPQSAILKDFSKQWIRAPVHPSEKLRPLQSEVCQCEVSEPHCEDVGDFPKGHPSHFLGRLNFGVDRKTLVAL